MTTEKSGKNPQKYICINCDYLTTDLKDYKKHLHTKKHKSTFSNNISTEKSVKYPQKYICINCDYSTCDIKDYNKHLNTNKHIGSTTKIYMCEYCNKEYKDRSGLWRHKQKCIKNQNVLNDASFDIVNNDKMINVVLELVKQNSEFKDLLVEQNKYIIEQNKQNTNLQNQFIEIAKEKTMNNCHNNIHNTTNNTNNNHFNLQLFLNETCKNAMNITDFVEQINISLTDLENTGRLGYAEGISRIFVKGLKELEVNQRPIHCSDGKRETLYIKDGNVWQKDDNNKTRLTNAIKKVAHKNIRKITDWVNVHPNCKDSESNKNDLYLKIVSNSMSGLTDEEAEDNFNKIKKNIVKEVIINKE
jgi:hypothetical protein